MTDMKKGHSPNAPDPSRKRAPEADSFPDPDANEAQIQGAGGQINDLRTDAGTEAMNPGYDVPASPLARAERVLAQAQGRVPTKSADEMHAEAMETSRQRSEERTRVAPASMDNYDDFDAEVEGEEQVLDLMTGTASFVKTHGGDEVPGWFREFKDDGPGETRMVGDQEVKISAGQIAYEKFMHEPVVIRVHKSSDKNAPPLVFVGVNGDSRWLPRGRPVRIPRKLVERLAQAQEALYSTEDDPDPRVDQVKRVVQSTAAACEFTVVQDRNPRGRRWLARMVRSGS